MKRVLSVSHTGTTWMRRICRFAGIDYPQRHFGDPGTDGHEVLALVRDPVATVIANRNNPERLRYQVSRFYGLPFHVDRPDWDLAERFWGRSIEIRDAPREETDHSLKGRSLDWLECNAPEIADLYYSIDWPEPFRTY